MSFLEIRRVVAAAAVSAMVFVTGLLVATHSEISWVPHAVPRIIGVLALMWIGATVVATALAYLLRGLRMKSLKAHVVAPVSIVLLLRIQDFLLIIGEAFRTKPIPAWSLPTQVCNFGQPGELGSLATMPRGLALAALAGLTYWAMAYGDRFMAMRADIAAKPALRLAVVWFWACALGVMFWESFSYLFDAGSISYSVARLCIDWMSGRGNTTEGVGE